MSDAEAVDYRFTTEVETRFRDLDALGHVNHVVYLTIVEEAKIRYFANVLKLPMPEGMNDWVLAEIRCRYLAPLKYGERLAVGLKASWMRNSSFGMVYEVRSASTGAVVASGEFVQVHVAASGRSSPLPETVRSAITEYEGTQPPPPA